MYIMEWNGTERNGTECMYVCNVMLCYVMEWNGM